MNEELKDCNCISKLAEDIKAQITTSQTQKQKGYNLIRGKWENLNWFPKFRLYSNYIIESTFEKKDGSTSKLKKDHVVILYTYCPFCGNKFPN